jgi:hypothetical protein
MKNRENHPVLGHDTFVLAVHAIMADHTTTEEKRNYQNRGSQTSLKT